MYDSTTTVAVGLDVHARSIRLAAVRADELLEERTLPYDEEALERILGRWPGARCCYEAGPTGFGLQRHLVERGIDCLVVAPGLVPRRPGDRVKTDSRDARKLARLLAGGLLEAIHVPSLELEAARDLVRAREDARL
jgi:transposase